MSTFDRESWKTRVTAWWQNAVLNLPATMNRLGVKTAYGLLTASAWLPLLEAYGPENPGPAIAALSLVTAGVGTNLLSNLVQGAYDKATAPRKAEQEVQQDESLRAEHRQIVEQLDVLAAAQAALGDRWEGFYGQLCQEDRRLGGALHIETGGGAYFAGSVDNRGNLVGRDQHIGGSQYNFYGLAGAAATAMIKAIAPQAAGQGLADAAECYLRCLLDRHLYLRLKGLGVSDRVPLRLPLLDLYVPLRARVQMPEGETWGRVKLQDDDETVPSSDLELAGRELAGHMLPGRLSEPRPVLDLLAENPGLIILGDPGAGKTTFLKYLTLKLALGEGEAVGLNRRLPVLVPLSAYANALAEKDVRLDDFIAAYLRDMGSDLPVADLLGAALKEGRALILLDGLDEVRQARLRHVVVERVIDFFTYHRQPGNKFVLTSRVVGYREVRAEAEGLVECTLIDLDDDEIADFVQKWTAALERQAGGESAVAAGEAEREQRELLLAVRGSPSVRRLAANPLLLTILALMKRQGVTLPERRVELYDQYVKTLLSSWNRARGLGRPPARDLDVLQTMRVLAPLALWMHETSPGVGLVRRGEMQRKLVEIYTALGETDPEPAVRQFLADVREHAGLLLERGAGQYGFIHLTFEEYLAAVGIARLAQEDVAQVVEVLAAHVGEAAWREASLLTVGHLGIVQQWEAMAGEVVAGLLARTPGESGEVAVLAGEAVLDAWPGGVTAQCKAGVERALVQTMQSAEVAPKLRRQAGLILGRLGWQPGDLDAFIDIPPGPFLYGDQKEKREIAGRYWIAKYPVTNGQYRRFVEDKGYDRREWWSEEGWAWRTGVYDSKAPDYLKDRLARRPAELRGQPFWWDDLRWNNCLCPVVGVCWFEAEAYCRWLSEQLKMAKGKLQDAQGNTIAICDSQFEVRLPTEEEWERAVRGTDGRAYPWGDEIALPQLNFADAWAGKVFKDDNEWLEWARNVPDFAGTSAVCAYPQGANPAGLWDGAGNVWEWTSSWYDRERLARVVRGGSWDLANRGTRCACRVRLNGDFWYLNLGFRVSVSLAFSGF